MEPIILESRISKSIKENRKYFHEKLNVDTNFDMLYRDLVIGGKDSIIYFIDGLCKDELMMKMLQYFIGLKESDLPADAAGMLKKNMPYVEVDLQDNWEQIVYFIMSGVFALFIDGYDRCLLIDSRTYPARSVSEPEKDKALRGSKDGFVETVVFNTALIRRRIRSTHLRMEMFHAGNSSQTDIVLCYMDNRVDHEYLEKIKQRIKNIQVDALTMNQESLAECLYKRKWYNPFSWFRSGYSVDVKKTVTETYVDIVLPKSIGDIEITWSSSRISSLTKDGIVNRSEEDVTVLLTGTFAYNGIKVQKYFDILIKGWTDKEKVERVINDINFNDDLSFDLILSDSLGYGTNAEWLSSNTSVLTNDGKYTYDENVSTITLKVIVSLGSESMSKEFILNVMPKEEAKKDHLVIKRAESFESSKFNNVELKEGVLVLSAGFTEGSYESETIETLSFTSLVASWAAVSSTTSTVELFVSARVNGVWSDYISYKEWGLGLQNACYDQTNSLIKLSTDEVMVLNSKKADAIKFKVVLRTTTNTTPKLSLVSFALEVPGYTYPVDISKYPTSVIHSVPKLYQQVVPTIGNSICSATSSTMLLKYKGEDFSSFDSEYEHRYIAGIVRDYGNKIYGNWVYNTVAMSAYGYDSYVARFYSINELVEHLATVGPCALSVKGQMNSDKKNYYTNGHLIVAIGYEIDTNGNITIVCNDPNVSSVECRYSLTVMNNTWRNIAYVIE